MADKPLPVCLNIFRVIKETVHVGTGLLGGWFCTVARVGVTPPQSENAACVLPAVTARGAVNHSLGIMFRQVCSTSG